MDSQHQLRRRFSDLLLSVCLFGFLWILYDLRQFLLPQVPGFPLPVLADSILVKPLVWGIVPLVLLGRDRNSGAVITESWFSGSFPVLPCIVALCLSLCFLHTLRLIQGLMNTFVQWSWMFVVLSLSAGVVEEIGFRGCFFTRQEALLGFWPGALISSALFTLYHYPQLLHGESLLCLVSWRALLVFVMGMVFCWMLKKWNNLALNMVVHTVWDILSYVFCMF